MLPTKEGPCIGDFVDRKWKKKRRIRLRIDLLKYKTFILDIAISHTGYGVEVNDECGKGIDLSTRQEATQGAGNGNIQIIIQTGYSPYTRTIHFKSFFLFLQSGQLEIEWGTIIKIYLESIIINKELQPIFLK